jgi:hypothetical protein
MRGAGRAGRVRPMSGNSEKDEAPPGTGPAPGGAGDFSTTMAAIAAARERGDLDEVKRLKAEFAAARAQE